VPELRDRVAEAHARWLLHVERWKNCQECPLCAQRNKIVLARGVVPCDVLFLGEAPGNSEDVSGQPFDGPAGDLLEKIVDAVRRTSRVRFTEAYTNVVCCFPAEAKKTADHRPEPEEIQACSPRLQEFVEIASPRLIVCVGKVPKDWGPIVCGADSSVQWCDIVHPSHILSRMPAAQKDMAAKNCSVIIRDAVERALGAYQ
jgi:uracil-DNA glycosylase family 4